MKENDVLFKDYEKWCKDNNKLYSNKSNILSYLQSLLNTKFGARKPDAELYARQEKVYKAMNEYLGLNIPYDKKGWRVIDENILRIMLSMAGAIIETAVEDKLGILKKGGNKND